MRQLKVDLPRGTVSVNVYGEGPAILLVPGGSAACEGYFPYLREGLATVGTVIEHDRPGTGHSGLTAGTLSEQAADLAAVIEAVGAGPALLVGHSLGGPVSVQLGLNHPSSVRSMVLVDPTALNAPKVISQTVTMMNVLATLYGLPVVGKALDLLLAKTSRRELQGVPLTPELERATALFADRQEVPRLKKILQGFPADAAALTTRLTPTLHGILVTADRKTSSPAYKAHAALASATGLSLEQWQGTTHGAHVQRPERLLDTVTRLTQEAHA